MSDRRLLERLHASSQRQAAVERRVRAMQLYTYPGAVRSTKGSTFTPADPAATNTIIQQTVSRGRWLLSVDFNLVIVDPDPPIEFVFRGRVWDTTTGIVLPSGGDLDLPERSVYMPYTGSGIFSLLVVYLGDVILDEPSSVGLEAECPQTYAAYSPRLRMTPV